MVTFRSPKPSLRVRVLLPLPKNPSRKTWIFSFVPQGTTSFAWHTQHHFEQSENTIAAPRHKWTRLHFVQMMCFAMMWCFASMMLRFAQTDFAQPLAIFSKQCYNEVRMAVEIWQIKNQKRFPWLYKAFILSVVFFILSFLLYTMNFMIRKLVDCVPRLHFI